jgi:MYXO-CTERM domain-containing protein
MPDRSPARTGAFATSAAATLLFSWALTGCDEPAHGGGDATGSATAGETEGTDTQTGTASSATMGDTGGETDTDTEAGDTAETVASTVAEPHYGTSSLECSVDAERPPTALAPLLLLGMRRRRRR